MRHLGEIEAVRGGERQHDIVFSRRSLQLEIEFAAEALAEREAPGPVDAAAIGGVDHELHAACLVEEALEDQRLAGRQRAERAMRRAEIVDDLLGRRTIETKVIHDPTESVRSIAFGEAMLEFGAGNVRPTGRALCCALGLLRARMGSSAARHAHPPRARRRARRG